MVNVEGEFLRLAGLSTYCNIYRWIWYYLVVLGLFVETEITIVTVS